MFLAGLGDTTQSKPHKGQAQGWFSMQISTARAKTKLLWRDMCGVEAAVLVFFLLLCAPSPACSKFASQQPQPLSVTQISNPTLAMSEIVSQLPPLMENFPPPIRVRISSGVSLGPFAKGVQLGRKERALDLLTRWEERHSCPHRAHWGQGSQPQPLPYPASIVYSRTPRLQMSQPSS